MNGQLCETGFGRKRLRTLPLMIIHRLSDELCFAISAPVSIVGRL